MRTRRTLRGVAIAAALMATSSCEPRAAPDSIFTSLRAADCTAPSQEAATAYVRRDLGVQQCPAPEGWRLLLVSSDENTWVDVHGPALDWSAERPVVYEMPIGLFPSVDTEKGVEWRRKGPALTAMILRVLAQDREALTTQQSRLFVVRLTAASACVIGRVETEDAARELADGDRSC